MKYTAVSVRQLDRKGKPWQARAKYKDVYGKWKEVSKMLPDAKGKKEANKMATSLTNEKIHTFITNVMGHIKRAALEGKTREIICCLSANNEVYERAVDFLKALGYSVSGSPSQGCSITIKW